MPHCNGPTKSVAVTDGINILVTIKQERKGTPTPPIWTTNK